MIVLRTPGHSAGHQVLLVNLPQTGAVLAATRCISARTTMRSACPRSTTTARAVRSVDGAHQEHRIEPKAKVIIQHDARDLIAFPGLCE